MQYNPGLSADELARAGRFPNRQISFAQRSDLVAALSPLGYRLQLQKTLGEGYHHTLMVLYDTNGTLYTVLPLDAAQALALVFQRQQNPYPVPRP